MVRTAWLSGIKKCSARVLAENGVKNVPGLQNSVSWIMDWYAVPEEYESVLMGERGGGGMHTHSTALCIQSCRRKNKM
jgi:hypothetical protein